MILEEYWNIFHFSCEGCHHLKNAFQMSVNDVSVMQGKVGSISEQLALQFLWNNRYQISRYLKSLRHSSALDKKLPDLLGTQPFVPDKEFIKSSSIRIFIAYDSRSHYKWLQFLGSILSGHGISKTLVTIRIHVTAIQIRPDAHARPQVEHQV